MIKCENRLSEWRASGLVGFRRIAQPGDIVPLQDDGKRNHRPSGVIGG